MIYVKSFPSKKSLLMDKASPIFAAGIKFIIVTSSLVKDETSIILTALAFKYVEKAVCPLISNAA